MCHLSSALCLTGVVLSALQSPVPPDRHDDPTQVMQRAQDLATNGQFEVALSEMLWCYDYGAIEAPAFSGVRGSFLLSKIVELGKNYPPALTALQERRDAIQQQAAMAKGSPGLRSELMDLVALNHYLGDDSANLVLYDQIKKDVPDSPMLKFIVHFVEDELVKAGRGDEARDVGLFSPVGGKRTPIERAYPLDDAVRTRSDTATQTTTTYSLDNARYAAELANIQEDAERLEVLYRRWDDVVLATTYCDVVTGMSFHKSIRHWQGGCLATNTWTLQSDGDLTATPEPLNKASVLIKGNCQTDVTVSDGGMVHIYGDLCSILTISGQSEVVIGGNIRTGAAIEADGIVRVFVGGNVDGRISNKGSTMLWINGNLTGSIHAGRPKTDVHVMGDYLGQLEPIGVAALAYLDVRGLMSFERIENTIRFSWTEFNASIGVSDLAPGLYPKSQTSNSRWVVHSRQ